jgi:membrane protein implicated in regulation of membrane protease activity
VIFLICLAVTWAVIRAARKSPQAGVEDLIGVSARITSVKELTYGIEYRVKIEGELWNARSSDRLAAGELVTVEKVNGLLLQVKRAKTESPPG